MKKRNIWLMLFALMMLSDYAFSRAGVGYGGFRSARSFGRSSGNLYFDLTILGIIVAYDYLKSCFKKKNQSSNPDIYFTKIIESQVEQLYQQREINLNSTQLKHHFSEIYIALQQAWMKQNLSQANHVLSEKLIRDLNKPLNSLKRRQLVDYIRDIEFTQIKFIKISKMRKKHVIRVRLTGLMVDERINFKQINTMENKVFPKKEFNDIMEFQYDSLTSNWQAIFLKT